VDGTINSTRLIDALIEREVDSEMLVPLITLGGGKLEIVQMEIGDDSPALGTPLKNMRVPPGCLIVSVVRNGEPSLPTGDMVLKPGDTVVVLLAPGMADSLRRCLAAE
jgi:trk system potassium uptake protein TrkA